jgi:hypothetical protein
MEYKASFVTPFLHLQSPLCNTSGLNLTALPKREEVLRAKPTERDYPVNSTLYIAGKAQFA